MAHRLAVTGILLVGGASERFGSPKALARIGDETLADRAWRLLQETCDEVLAVGKADELELLFPVLDDGLEERAPIHGVLAGLRAASHDLSVVLPVDCPLLTTDALRALAAARAVPQTGPLPGAYAKAMLPALEARANGDRSLRGVNENVLELDEALLLNVNTRADLLVAAVTAWARPTEDVRAVVLVGSQARRDAPADRWSDVDLLLFVDDPDRYLRDEEWIATFGVPLLTFLEPTALGGSRERRVLYEDGVDVDFPLLTAESAAELASQPGAGGVLARGYRVLHDELGIARLLADAAVAEDGPLPGQAAFTELASDFWYHALWTAKKLRRGEVYTAKGCLDGYLKARLVTLLEWHARALDPMVDTWHDGRFLESWADAGALAALEDAYARYDLRDAARALWATIDLWQGLEAETARRLGLRAELDHADLRRRVSEVVRDPRPVSTLWP